MATVTVAWLTREGGLFGGLLYYTLDGSTAFTISVLFKLLYELFGGYIYFIVDD
jgi:hypothetical protein